MANEMNGLFSTATPQQLQQQYLQSQRVSGAQMGQQDLINRGISMMSNAGSNIGGIGSRMLGGTLPGEDKQAFIAKTTQELSASGLSPQEQMLELSKRLNQAGYAAEGAQALDRANSLKTTALDQQMKGAQVRGAEADADVSEGTVANKIALSLADLNYKNASVADMQAGTASTIAATARSKQLLPYEVETFQSNLATAKQALEERQDLAPLEKQRLQGQIKAAESQLKIQQEQAPLRLKQLQGQVKEIEDNQQLRAALQKLPEGATTEQYMNVMKQYGDPEKVMTAINRLETTRLNNEAKKEAAIIRAEAKKQNMPKEVASAFGSIAVLDQAIPKLEGFIKDIDLEKVDFSATSQAGAYARGLRGNPTEADLKVAEINREFMKQANLILQAANGVQTDRDAQRAYDSIRSSIEKYSNVGIKQALQGLVEWQSAIRLKAQTEINVRGYGEPAKKATDIDLDQFNQQKGK